MAKNASDKLIDTYAEARAAFSKSISETLRLAARTAAVTQQQTTLQRHTSVASLSMKGINNVIPSVREAIVGLAQQSRYIGSALNVATLRVKQASQKYEEVSDELNTLKDTLGVETDTISGILKINAATKQVQQQKTALIERELSQIKTAITSQEEVIKRNRDEAIAASRSLSVTKDAINAVKNSIVATKNRVESLQVEHITAQRKLEADKQLLQSAKERKSAAEREISGLTKLTNEKYREVIKTQQSLMASEQLIDAQTQNKNALQSEIDILRRKFVTTGLLSEAEVQRMRSLENEVKQSEISIQEEVARKASLEQTLQGQQDAYNFLKDSVIAQQRIVDQSTSQIEYLAKEIEKGGDAVYDLKVALHDAKEKRDEEVRKLKELNAEEASLIKTVGETRTALEESIATADDLARAQQKKAKELDASKQKELNIDIDKYQQILQKSAQITGKVAEKLNSLVESVRAMQQQFGLSAGSAAKLKFENIVTSIESFADSLMSGGAKAAVSAEQIAAAQADFQSEFGGVLTSDAAKDLAIQAKEMGVTTGQLAKARRVFMTQTMGDVGGAKIAQDKFIGEFTKKGLTSKDAMEAIGQNSNLLARNGTRFAASFARAAADAKKIGVDLSKIDQVGDNIIDNFEGFLESQAELGAMGFGFDTSRLAELAEGGDTGALMEELRSQLASQGKDLTKLRRSEQLALSKSFGLSMEELQRMAGPTGGSGEKTLSPEELQQDSNKSLTKLVNIAEVMAAALGTAVTLLTIISSNTAMSGLKNIISSGGIRNAARNTLSAARSRIGGGLSSMRGSGLGARIGGMGTLARVGTGLGVGVAGGLMSAGGEKLKEAGYTKTGGAVATLGEVAKYAGIGMMFGPVGAAIGGLVGAVIGITKNFDSWKEIGKAAFDLVASGFSMFGKVIMKLVDVFMTLNPVSLISSLFTNGAGGTVDKVKSLFGMGETKKGDDVVSKSGYGERTLVTPSGPIALNNNDNVIAYADDMISGAIGEGIRMLSYGALTSKEPAAPQINIDLSRLEQKLDAVVRAIGSMEVKMDGNKVGKVLVNTSDSARTVGVFRQDARATL